MSGTVVKHWSRAHATRALSVAATGYHVIDTGMVEGLGMQSLLSGFELQAELRTWTDSNAAKAMVYRRGLG